MEILSYKNRPCCTTLSLQEPKAEYVTIWSPAFQRAVQITVHITGYAVYTSDLLPASVGLQFHLPCIHHHNLQGVFYISWILLDFHSIYVPSILTFFPSTIMILSISVVGLS